MNKEQQIRKRSAFTLIELLVVVAIIALLISILLPTLGRAREQTKSVKCLSNLKTLGQGVMIYVADWNGYLPGPLHPALFRNQDLADQEHECSRLRHLPYMLKKTFGDSSTYGQSISDEVSTCPTMVGMNPDSNFEFYYKQTGNRVYPTDYVINNIGTEDVASESPSSATDNLRATDPTWYFGASSWACWGEEGKKYTQQHPPKQLSKVKNAAREWMIADAWYRPRTNSGLPEFQQEGPYQTAYSGDAFPNFAPHFAKGGLRSYRYIPKDARSASSSQIRQGKRDGRTNTVFFDGHAEAVTSKRFIIRYEGGQMREFLYGFPGTVNPLKYKSTGDWDILPYWE